jgi:hypothetical protein
MSRGYLREAPLTRHNTQVCVAGPQTAAHLPQLDVKILTPALAALLARYDYPFAGAVLIALAGRL